MRLPGRRNGEPSGSGRAIRTPSPGGASPHSVSLTVAWRVRRRISVSKLRPISRPLEAGFLRPPDRNRAGPVLRLYAVLAVFIGKFALRGNTLFPERAAG